jgi:hypothetical protein
VFHGNPGKALKPGELKNYRAKLQALLESVRQWVYDGYYKFYDARHRVDNNIHLQKKGIY